MEKPTLFEGNSEECGDFIDRKIAVSMNGEEVQSFFKDFHGLEEFEYEED